MFLKKQLQYFNVQRYVLYNVFLIFVFLITRHHKTYFVFTLVLLTVPPTSINIQMYSFTFNDKKHIT